MSIAVDLVAVGIIIFFAVLSAKRGFVRSLIEVIGFGLEILFIGKLSPYLANITYDKFVEPSILNTIGNVESGGIVELPQLPKFVSTLLGNNFDLSALQNYINENISAGVTDAVAKASQQIIKPVVANILSLLYAIILSIVLMFLIRIIAKIINKIFSFSIVGKVNRLLGGLLGIVKGIAVVAIICSVVSALFSIYPAGLWILTPNVAAGSVAFKLLTFKI